jgi:WD40 repeat protein
VAYDGFISYSHAADGALAPALQQGLQRLAKPWHSRRALRIFRDETGLSTNPHLWSAIEAALDESAWFVLLASPEAARSEWVNKEISHWLATKSVDRVLPVVTDGSWEWDPTAGDFTAESSAVPDALRGALAEEPRHLDVRWARSETDLDLRNSRFRSAVADLAAPMHGVPKDDLEGEDIRQHRLARRLARGAVSVLALLVVIAVVFGVLAVEQRGRAISERDRANRQARLANASRLATVAVSGAHDDLSRSALLAIEANRLDDNAQTRGAILSLAEDAAPVREIIHGSWDAAAVAPDGQTVATVGAHGISIVDLQTRHSRSISGRNFDGIRSVSFSPNGSLLAIGGNDVEILDAHTGAPARAPFRFTDQTGPQRTLVVHVRFSPDGSNIAAIDNNGDGYLWSLGNGAELALFSSGSYGGGTSNVVFSPDGRWLTFTDSHAVVYSARSFRAGQLEPRYGAQPFVGFSEFDVAFSPDGTKFAAATGGGQIVFRDAATGAEVGPAISTGSGVVTLAFSPDGTTIAGSRPDGTIAVWDTRESAGGSQAGELLHDSLLAGTRSPLSLSFAPDGALVVLTTAEIVVLDPSAQLGRQIAAPVAERGFGVDALVAAPDGRSIAAADGLGHVRVWDLASNRLERTINATTTTGYGAQAVAYQPGTDTIAVGAGEGTVTGWSVRTGHQVHRPLRLAPPSAAPAGNLSPGDGVLGVAFDASGHTLVAATGDGRVVVIDPKTWTVQRTIHLVNDAIETTSTLAISADGNTVALGATGVVAMSDIHGAHRRQIDIGPFETATIALAPGGSLLAAGLEDGRVVLADPVTAHVNGAIVSNHNEAESLAFDSTGTTLAVGGGDGDITLWNVADRQAVGPPLTSSQDLGIAGLVFSPGGDGLFAAAGDLSLVRYDLRPPEQIQRLCAVIGRNLTPDERRAYLGDADAGRQTCKNWPSEP